MQCHALPFLSLIFIVLLFFLFRLSFLSFFGNGVYAMRMIRQFIAMESSAGILLIAAAILAWWCDNSNAHDAYQAVLAFKWGSPAFFLHFSVLEWVNNALMAIFFLLVGLEIKRELIIGELRSFRKSMMPLFAAIGGMVIPALLFVFFNHDDAVRMRGWPVPTATDIAFSLGILSLLGTSVHTNVKIFLTALAIFDDIGAIVIIATFYGHHVVGVILMAAVVVACILFLLNRLGVVVLWPYLLLGVLLWYLVLQSGIHATISGIVLAMFIPLKSKKNVRHSPLKVLEHRLHPWVAFLILPLFALANAGVRTGNLQWHDIVQPVGLGIILGLWIGKPLGIVLACYLGRLCGLVLPEHVNQRSLLGLGFLAGIGFTMSLFVGMLAFYNTAPHYILPLKLGVVLGSLLSALCGTLCLLWARPVDWAAQP